MEFKCIGHSPIQCVVQRDVTHHRTPLLVIWPKCRVCIASTQTCKWDITQNCSELVIYLMETDTRNCERQTLNTFMKQEQCTNMDIAMIHCQTMNIQLRTEKSYDSSSFDRLTHGERECLSIVSCRGAHNVSNSMILQWLVSLGMRHDPSGIINCAWA